MNIIIGFALYIVIGVGVMWFILKVIDDYWPEIMDYSNNLIHAQYKENMKNCATKQKAKIRWFIVRRVMPLLIWPVLVLTLIVLCFIAKLKGEI